MTQYRIEDCTEEQVDADRVIEVLAVIESIVPDPAAVELVITGS
jgi:hypothetical protein